MDMSEYIDKLKRIVNTDSGSGDEEGIRAVSAIVKSWYEDLGFQAAADADTGCLEIKNYEGGKADFMFSGHLDTVFPHGTAAERPFTIVDRVAHGPGAADMKGGVVLMYLLAKDILRKYPDTKILVFLNSDEELGSLKSYEAITEKAGNAVHCFVFEPGRINGEFVGERKGIIEYKICFHGVAAHAGINPQDGASAVRMMAKWALKLEELSDYSKGTSVNVGLVRGGTAVNVVPDYAEMSVESRFETIAEKSRVCRGIETIKQDLHDAKIGVDVRCVSTCPPMEMNAQTKELQNYFLTAGKKLDRQITFIKTGGVSDANHISAAGIAVIDGCGPCGTNLHNDKEYLLLDSVSERMRLLLKVVDLIREG